MDDLTLMFIAGVIILTMSLFLHLHKKHRLEAQRKLDRRKAALEAREKAIRQQKMMGEPVKLKPASTNLDRIPLPDAVDKTFTGSFSPQSIAKWEVEMHQIGRQMMGQIDSKMIALQTLSMEANRSANRLELLIEHLEQLIEKSQEHVEIKEVAKNTIESRGNASGSESVANLVPEAVLNDASESHVDEQTINSDKFDNDYSDNNDDYNEILKELEEEIQTIPISSAQIRSNPEIVEPTSEQDSVWELPKSPNLLSSDEVHEGLERFADVLDSLESEVEDFQKDIDQLKSFSGKEIPSAKILKVSVPEDEAQATIEKEQKTRQADAFGQKLPETAARAETSRAVDPLKNQEKSPVSVSSAMRESVRDELGNPFALSSPRLPGGEAIFEKGSPFSSKTTSKQPLDFQPTPALPVPNPYTTSAGAKPLGSGGTAKRITVGASQALTGTSKPKRSANGLSVETLYQNDLRGDSVELSDPPARHVPQLPSSGSHLTLRKQVEMLAQSGYTANQIAQHLNITVGEVDLMLSLKN